MFIEIQKLRTNIEARRKSHFNKWDSNALSNRDYSLLWTECDFFIQKLDLLLKKRSSKRRRISPKGKQSNVRKAGVARRAKRRNE